VGPSSTDAATPSSRPFQVAYLLLTHKEATDVEGLVERLLQLSPGGQVVIHHDAGAASIPWDGDPPDRVHLAPRSHVRWGDWSMVEAMLRLVRFALDELGADWLVFVSGEDRPVVDLAAWEAEIAGAGIDGIVPALALPSRLRFGRAHRDENFFLARCVHRWRVVRQPRRRMGQRALGVAFRAGWWMHPLFKLEFANPREAWAVGVPRRRGAMRGVTFHKGPQWIALSSEAARPVLDVDPAFPAWFKRSWIPDETYFHTILYNTPELVLRNAILTYRRPAPPRPYPNWMRLEPEDLDDLWRSGAVFARKVDSMGHPEVLAAIDAAVDRQRSATDAVSRLGWRG
jgi:core-2/I-Branching enzyme